MWFEILPPAVIIGLVLSVPAFGLYGLNKLVIGNGYRRGMEDYFSRMMYRRDFRLTDNPYKINGLDAIPDEEK